MIDNPQVGQEVVVWSHAMHCYTKAIYMGEGRRGDVKLALNIHGHDVRVERSPHDVYTPDDALPLLLMEAAGQHPGEENEHHGRTH